jgi:hypothetical protein
VSDGVKDASLFHHGANYSGACTIKLFTAVIVAYRNKLERLPLLITFTLV